MKKYFTIVSLALFLSFTCLVPFGHTQALPEDDVIAAEDNTALSLEDQWRVQIDELIAMEDTSQIPVYSGKINVDLAVTPSVIVRNSQTNITATIINRGQYRDLILFQVNIYHTNGDLVKREVSGLWLKRGEKIKQTLTWQIPDHTDNDAANPHVRYIVQIRAISFGGGFAQRKAQLIAL